MSGSVQAEQASVRLHQPLRLPARAHRVRKADRLHCTTCSTVCFAHASCFYSFFWLLCRRAFIANGVMLSEIDMELTSQTVVFAFFVCQSGATIAGAFQFSNKQGLRDRSSDEKKCLARRLRSEARVKSWGNMTQPIRPAWWGRQRDAI